MDELGKTIERTSSENKENQRANVSWDAKQNYVYVVQGKIALKATEDKIVILLDKFRTGFECKECDGDGITVTCPVCGGAGSNRFGHICTNCEGAPAKFENATCLLCNGRGSTIVIPDSAKTLPTSGIIVSIGPKCVNFKVGDRVLFGAHTGYMLPLKGNIRLRVMREFEPICEVFMLDNNNKTLGDFIQYEDPIDNR